MNSYIKFAQTKVYKYKNQVLVIMKLKHNKFAPTKKSKIGKEKPYTVAGVCLFIYLLFRSGVH